MTKRKIVRINSDEVQRLYYKNEYTRDIVDENPVATIVELAALCDRDAENRNAHDFCGVHEKLADILVEIVPKKAKEIMMAIAELGGLQGMNDICQH